MTAVPACGTCTGWRTPAITVGDRFGGVDSHGASTGIRATAVQVVAHTQTHHAVSFRAATLHHMCVSTLASTAGSCALNAVRLVKTR